MISFKESKNIYLYSENIDMRMGMNKIQIIVLVLKIAFRYIIILKQMDP